jgi:hypothetical protein
VTTMVERVERARVMAGERAVIQDLHDRGLCDVGGTCEICHEKLRQALSPQPLTAELEDKLATVLWFMEEARAGRRQADWPAVHSYLDDPQVSAWLTSMDKAGRVRNTRFTATPPSSR